MLIIFDPFISVDHQSGFDMSLYLEQAFCTEIFIPLTEGTVRATDLTAEYFAHIQHLRQKGQQH